MPIEGGLKNAYATVPEWKTLIEAHNALESRVAQLGGAPIGLTFPFEQPTDPGAVGSGRLWLDTSPGAVRLGRRNLTNTAWEFL
jgi:hypothetical protein